MLGGASLKIKIQPHDSRYVNGSNRENHQPEDHNQNQDQDQNKNKACALPRSDTSIVDTNAAFHEIPRDYKMIDNSSDPWLSSLPLLVFCCRDYRCYLSGIGSHCARFSNNINLCAKAWFWNIHITQTFLLICAGHAPRHVSYLKSPWWKILPITYT